MSSDAEVKKDSTATTRQKVSTEETEVAFSGPSTFCNKFYLHLTPIAGRLTFGEIYSGPESFRYRTAVTLGINDLLELSKLIQEMLPQGKLKEIQVKDGDQEDG